LAFHKRLLPNCCNSCPALINAITKKNSTTPDDDPSPLHELFGTSGNNGISGTAKSLLGGFLNK